MSQMVVRFNLVQNWTEEIQNLKVKVQIVEVYQKINLREKYDFKKNWLYWLLGALNITL